MSVNHFATFVAGSAAVAAALAGIATTTAAPANAAPKFSSIAYSSETGAWGWSMLAGSEQQAIDVAMGHCVRAGGRNCITMTSSEPGGCVALVRTAGGSSAGGRGRTNEEAQSNAYGSFEGGGEDLLVITCSGLDSEPVGPTGAGGVSPLPAAPQSPEAPPPPPPPVEAPKQGPTVVPKPGVLGVTFTITDRSGVASQCTYSSEGFEPSFGLPANGSFDLFVPAVRLLKIRTGKVTCDNGTSTNTSVFF